MKISITVVVASLGALACASATLVLLSQSRAAAVPYRSLRQLEPFREKPYRTDYYLHHEYLFKLPPGKARALVKELLSELRQLKYLRSRDGDVLQFVQPSANEWIVYVPRSISIPPPKNSPNSLKGSDFWVRVEHLTKGG